MKELNYSFIRTEADNNVTLFLQVTPSWIEKELDLSLTSERELLVDIVNEGQFKTGKLEDLLHEQLANKETLIVFCDKDANFLAEHIVSPLQPVRKNKI